MNEHVTLLPPDPRGTPRAISAGLPDDLLSQSAERLRVLALLYAFVFFMAGIFPALLVPNDRARFLCELRPVGPRRHRDRGGPARRSSDPEPALPASRGDEPQPGIRNRQQLRHRGVRVRRSAVHSKTTSGFLGLSWVAVGSSCSRSSSRLPRAVHCWPRWHRSAPCPSSWDRDRVGRTNSVQ